MNNSDCRFCFIKMLEIFRCFILRKVNYQIFFKWFFIICPSINTFSARGIWKCPNFQRKNKNFPNFRRSFDEVLTVYWKDSELSLFNHRFATRTLKLQPTVQTIESVAHRETRIANVARKVVLFVQAPTVIVV